MKPIIQNIDELSDSAESFKRKTPLGIFIAIYSILGILIVAIVMSFWFSIDNSTPLIGDIQLNDNLIVQNEISGELVTKGIYDGKKVKKNDVLFEVSNKEIIMKEELLRAEYSKKNNELQEVKKIRQDFQKFVSRNEIQDNYLLYKSFKDTKLDGNVSEIEKECRNIESSLFEYSNIVNKMTVSAKYDGTIMLISDIQVGKPIQGNLKVAIIIPEDNQLFVSEINITKNIIENENITIGKSIDCIVNYPENASVKMKGKIVNIVKISDQESGVLVRISPYDIKSVYLNIDTNTKCKIIFSKTKIKVIDYVRNKFF